jgi:hypothetical protein
MSSGCRIAEVFGENGIRRGVEYEGRLSVPFTQANDGFARRIGIIQLEGEQNQASV